MSGYTGRHSVASYKPPAKKRKAKSSRTTLTTTVTAEFPFVESFADYHYIEDEAERLTKLFKRRVGFMEVGFCQDSKYWGVFYVGRRPALAVIRELGVKAEYVSMHDGDYLGFVL